MADNTALNRPTVPNGDVIRTDDIGGGGWTTDVKPYLKEWKKEREKEQEEDLEMQILLLTS